MRSVDIEEMVDVVPSRFEDWALDVTAEALNALEAVAPELDLDDGRAIVTDLPGLKAALEAARTRKADRRSRRRRTYGGVYVYDYPPDVDLRWQVEPLDTTSVRDRLALLPADGHNPWRWTDPERPDEGGFLLSPSEAMARVPTEFRAWVATRTYEALQHSRTRLAELTRRGLTDPEDLRELSLLASHAQELAAAGGRELAIGGLQPDDMPDEAEIAGEARSPDDRLVVLYASTWSHILAYHPDMEDCLEDVLRVVELPELRQPDPRAGRERMFRRGGPQSWLRVIVEFGGAFDRVVTAFPQANDPEGWDRR